MDEKQRSSGGTAVWYFVGATFLFAGTTIFGHDGWPAVRILGTVLGLVVLVAGFVVMRREFRARE
jgi:uncharacterized membrane protein YoaK (UPF0700 family)